MLSWPASAIACVCNVGDCLLCFLFNTLSTNIMIGQSSVMAQSWLDFGWCTASTFSHRAWLVLQSYIIQYLRQSQLHFQDCAGQTSESFRAPFAECGVIWFLYTFKVWRVCFESAGIWWLITKVDVEEGRHKSLRLGPRMPNHNGWPEPVATTVSYRIKY